MGVVRLPSRVHSLTAQRAKGFLRSLSERPFVAIVMEDSQPVVYCKGLDAEEALRIMQSVADQLESGEAHAETSTDESQE